MKARRHPLRKWVLFTTILNVCKVIHIKIYVTSNKSFIVLKKAIKVFIWGFVCMCIYQVLVCINLLKTSLTNRYNKYITMSI